MQATVMLPQVLRARWPAKLPPRLSPKHFMANPPNALSQEEKLTVSTLSQAAAGIAGGALANSSDGVGIAAQTAKGAVENNFFDQAYKSTDYANGLVANATVQTQLSEATRQAAEEFEKCTYITRGS